MYRLNQKERKNKPIHALLNNGFVFALMVNGAIVGKSRYQYQLTQLQKSKKGSEIVEIKNLLVS